MNNICFTFVCYSNSHTRVKCSLLFMFAESLEDDKSSSISIDEKCMSNP